MSRESSHWTAVPYGIYELQSVYSLGYRTKQPLALGFWKGHDFEVYYLHYRNEGNNQIYTTLSDWIHNNGKSTGPIRRDMRIATYRIESTTRSVVLRYVGDFNGSLATTLLRFSTHPAHHHSQLQVAEQLWPGWLTYRIEKLVWHMEKIYVHLEADQGEIMIVRPHHAVYHEMVTMLRIRKRGRRPRKGKKIGLFSNWQDPDDLDTRLLDNFRASIPVTFEGRAPWSLHRLDT